MSIVCPSPSRMTLTTRSSLFSLSALNCSFCQSFNGPNGNKDSNALDPVYWWFSFGAGLTKVLEGACQPYSPDLRNDLSQLVQGCRVGAVLNEEPYKIEMTAEGCQMEWGRPTLVLGCCVGAVLNEEPCEIEMTPL